MRKNNKQQGVDMRINQTSINKTAIKTAMQCRDCDLQWFLQCFLRFVKIQSADAWQCLDDIMLHQVFLFH